jgi:hypothetical protein
MVITNPGYQCRVTPSSRPSDFTAYATKTEARRSVNEAHNPVLVSLTGCDADGNDYVWYDAYPLGHPIPTHATVYYNDEGGTVRATVEIIERCVLTATGMKWRKVAEPDRDFVRAFTPNKHGEYA